MQPTVLIPAVIGDASQPLFAKAGINVITVPTVDAASTPLPLSTTASKSTGPSSASSPSPMRPLPRPHG